MLFLTQGVVCDGLGSSMRTFRPYQWYARELALSTEGIRSDEKVTMTSIAGSSTMKNG